MSKEQSKLGCDFARSKLQVVNVDKYVEREKEDDSSYFEMLNKHTIQT